MAISANDDNDDDDDDDDDDDFDDDDDDFDDDDDDFDDDDDDDDDGPLETWVPCDLSDRWRSQPSRSIAISEQSQLL